MREQRREEQDIRWLIERWAKAVRDEDREAIQVSHDQEILMFDVPPPLTIQGMNAYMATWDRFLAWSERPVIFGFRDVRVTAGEDVAFATAIGHCAGAGPDGRREALQFRLTLGLRKIEDSWRIVHEHHSVPAE